MATTDKVRVAVVGMGIGKPNGRALSANPRGQVVALCDLLEDRMQEFAEDLPEEVKFYTDYKQMCKDPEIDAVFVGTPNQWHVPVALEAVRNGKHVMVTKPLADSEAAAKELVAEAEAAGVVNMMSLLPALVVTVNILEISNSKDTSVSSTTQDPAASEETGFQLGV